MDRGHVPIIRQPAPVRISQRNEVLSGPLHPHNVIIELCLIYLKLPGAASALWRPRVAGGDSALSCSSHCTVSSGQAVGPAAETQTSQRKSLFF